MKYRTLLTIAIFAAWSNFALADERPYTDGSVWAMSMIRTADGLDDVYLESLGKTLKPIFDEAQKQGLILSYKIIGANAGGLDDWNILIMVEYKNWAAFDGLSEKFEPISRKVMSKTEETDLMEKRLTVRRFVANKTGQEIILK
ncbi:MAG: hypothetical protein HYY48_06175 [Gammaproteobacteria bacterium]|nr:hypothetical protein [Gammaproteobacteria bacterium]